ncbi:diphthine synthase [Halalkalicoccus jeotgali]|uniref:Diphthine synthase n=1 Tax=Halalkalicoccus jeotgali (strain DSM 18796 / CECT 7217 / JCM 14584 / KCTC 4019 / B3) TaxID=795797 RepID=D8J2X8_HALJB|nr:diphthine synthase [Halalkalicoccus jeotgali]ADJ15085.1 diphthine synthase [Halalkalicoccus jeotgali B3]ELY34896.1 diphthine synthase [Halalkalicoccus jeotgali B3]
MLTFIGLGLYDERSITVEGREVLRSADRVFMEQYTSRLIGTDIETLETEHGIEIELRDRAGVEQDPKEMLAAAEREDVAFLVVGDPMVSTTHVDLRLRAADRGIETRIVHGTTAEAAASSLTGLQNYRFGPATTLPFPYAHGAEGLPSSVTNTIDDNRERGLHTLVYLDIKHEREEYMTADVAAALLAAEYPDTLAVAVCRAGSPEPVVAADSLSELADREFGGPLHLLVIPGDLHHIEAEALRAFAGAPADLAPLE